jgi:hypothetical protein
MSGIGGFGFGLLRVVRTLQKSVLIEDDMLKMTAVEG